MHGPACKYLPEEFFPDRSLLFQEKQLLLQDSSGNLHPCRCLRLPVHSVQYREFLSDFDPVLYSALPGEQLSDGRYVRSHRHRIFEIQRNEYEHILMPDFHLKSAFRLLRYDLFAINIVIYQAWNVTLRMQSVVINILFACFWI